LAATAEAQSPAPDEGAAPASPPAVNVINPDQAAAPVAAAPPAATAEEQAAGSSAVSVTRPAGEPTGSPKAEAAAPSPPLPEPTLFISIDLSAQRMTVRQDIGESYSWPISSAAYGYTTPTGMFRPTWMTKMHYSRQYDLAPMPHAIFFSRGAAIHGTYAVRQLGRPASHGCVRLAPGNAAKLFRLVSEHGKAQTSIVVHGKPRFRDWEVAEGQRLRRAEQRRRYAYDDYYGYSAPYYAPRGTYYVKPRRGMRYYNRYGYGYGF
jgi:lipoprotein-anchoring transpeptidase ErfK/SrfK